MPSVKPVIFAEALAAAYFRAIILPDDYYGRLPALARSHAFSVAGLASLQQLKLIKDSLDQAIASGLSMQDWKKQVRNGKINLNLPQHRLDTIFRTNIQSAYNRGRCEQQNRNRDTRPYLLYDAVNDGRTRKTHDAMEGLVAQDDDPIWNIWTPLNGYNCRCRLISLTEKQAQRFINEDTRRLNDNPELANLRLSATPDNGWDYNPCAQPSEGLLRAIRNIQNNLPGLLAQAAVNILPTARPSLDDLLSSGRGYLDELIKDNPGPAIFRERLVALLAVAGISTETKAAVVGSGKQLVEEASQHFPDSWTSKADKLGRLHAFVGEERGYHYTVIDSDNGKSLFFPGIGLRIVKSGDGYLLVKDKSDAVHELTHRLQHAMPDLDDYFQELHVRRTAGDELEKLSVIKNDGRYGEELTRKDRYVDSYFGKEYEKSNYLGRSGAIEVMTKTFQAIFVDSKDLSRMLKKDNELLALAIALLIGFSP